MITYSFLFSMRKLFSSSLMGQYAMVCLMLCVIGGCDKSIKFSFLNEKKQAPQERYTHQEYQPPQERYMHQEYQPPRERYTHQEYQPPQESQTHQMRPMPRMRRAFQESERWPSHNIEQMDAQDDFEIYANNVQHIYFSFGSYHIDGESKEKVETLISQLAKVRNVKVILYGYADKVEAEDIEENIARKRLSAIKRVLLRSGVLTANNILIETKVFGKKDPLISYDTISNNPISRRVDVFIERWQ